VVSDILKFSIFHQYLINNLLVSPTIIDLSIQCIYPPALFKTEAAILARLYDNFIQPLPSSDSDLMDTNEEEGK
jgi:hypothetical protein